MDPPFPPRLLKVHTCLYIKHLHNAWVADAVGFLVGDWVPTRVYPRVYKIFNLLQVLSHMLHHFETHIVNIRLWENGIGCGVPVIWLVCTGFKTVNRERGLSSSSRAEFAMPNFTQLNILNWCLSFLSLLTCE